MINHPDQDFVCDLLIETRLMHGRSLAPEELLASWRAWRKEAGRPTNGVDVSQLIAEIARLRLQPEGRARDLVREARNLEWRRGEFLACVREALAEAWWKALDPSWDAFCRNRLGCTSLAVLEVMRAIERGDEFLPMLSLPGVHGRPFGAARREFGTQAGAAD